MRRMIALALVAAAMPTAAVAQSGGGTSPIGAAALARSVLRKLRSIEEVRFVADKLGPVFAGSVLDRAADRPDNPFASVMRTAEGKARLRVVLSEEFTRAYVSHLPELTDALVAHLATDLSASDLRAIDAFLDTPAGTHWAAEMVVLQQQSSSAGASIGARAGAEAVVATRKRLAAGPSRAK